MAAKMVVNPRILGGKSIIEGTRISVEFILDLLASDVSEEEIIADYPHLTRKDIRACLKSELGNNDRKMLGGKILFGSHVRGKT